MSHEQGFPSEVRGLLLRWPNPRQSKNANIFLASVSMFVFKQVCNYRIFTKTYVHACDHVNVCTCIHIYIYICVCVCASGVPKKIKGLFCVGSARAVQKNGLKFGHPPNRSVCVCVCVCHGL